MVQGTEKYRIEDDEANESKYEAENGLEKFCVTMRNTLTGREPTGHFESGDGHG